MYESFYIDAKKGIGNGEYLHNQNGAKPVKLENVATEINVLLNDGFYSFNIVPNYFNKGG